MTLFPYFVRTAEVTLETLKGISENLEEAAWDKIHACAVGNNCRKGKDVNDAFEIKKGNFP